MRILITGGSGYLGKALTKRWRDEHTVCIYSRSEITQAQLEEHPNVRKFIGDVRDQQRLRRAMVGCDVVIHAAALKRIEVGRYNPDEMVKTNVLGTINVIEAAQDSEVDRVVYVSSDKAWQPISAYGLSKAIGEALTLAANDMVRYRRPRFSVTRYGNVMGSTGSVIPTWRAAIAKGETIKVTDPDATRFWMSIDEACDLIDKAVTVMQGGERFIPRLPAFRLGDLAEATNGFGCEVIGLPAWEKLHEGMDDDNRSDTAPRMTLDDIRERLADV